MWSAGSEPAQVYLGLGVVGVLAHGTGAKVAPTWFPSDSPIDGWRRAVEMLALGKRPSRAQVFLSGALARPFIVGPVSGLKRFVEAHEIATSLAADATGLAQPCEVWLDAWDPDSACVAVAIERSLRDEIEGVASGSKTRLTVIRPWWVNALDAALQAGPDLPRLLAVEDTDALTLLAGDSSAFQSAATYAPKPDVEQRRALLARASLAANVSPEQVTFATMKAQGVAKEFGVRLEQVE